MSAAPEVVSLSLVSHTNAGKTTLARTLLGRDIGEVRDAPHVTEFADAHVLVETPAGERLLLWDTPGFGDSVRLVRRLRQAEHPIGRFLSEVWDRWKDRPFWASQQAVRNTRDEADVLLYLVNASEQIEAAGYIEPEMELLGWIGKPVVVLVNQLGAPRDADVETAEVERWRASLSSHGHVRAVLPLDAFARCWVQELRLFAVLTPLLAADRRAAFVRLADAWRVRRWAQFDAAMAALAAPVAAAVCARIAVPPVAVLRKLGSALGVADDDGTRRQAAALATLVEQLDADLHAATQELLACHDLEGRAAAEVEARVASDLAREGPLGEGKAAAVGGIVSGAVTGLVADLAAGGLTFGAGMLTGAIVGALGGAGVARAVNVVRGQTEDAMRWDDAFLHRLVTSSLLRYLAIAHYGRGRGDWRDSEYPSFWRDRVRDALSMRHAEYTAIFAMRGPPCDVARIEASLRPLLADTARALLLQLYPDAFVEAT